MDAPRPQRNRVHVDVFVPNDAAEARVAAALAAGGRLVDDSHAPDWWTLADAEGNEVPPGTEGEVWLRGAGEAPTYRYIGAEARTREVNADLVLAAGER